MESATLVSTGELLAKNKKNCRKDQKKKKTTIDTRSPYVRLDHRQSMCCWDDTTAMSTFWLTFIYDWASSSSVYAIHTIGINAYMCIQITTYYNIKANNLSLSQTTTGNLYKKYVVALSPDIKKDEDAEGTRIG